MRRVKLLGIEFAGWMADGRLHMAAAIDSEALAAAAAMFLRARGMLVRVTPVLDSEGGLIFVNVDAEVAA